MEHPFGTIKRQWGFDHIMTKKTKERANADVGLIFIAYNLRRLVNIIGIDKFREYLINIIKSLISMILHPIIQRNTNFKVISQFIINSSKISTYIRDSYFFI